MLAVVTRKHSRFQFIEKSKKYRLKFDLLNFVYLNIYLNSAAAANFSKILKYFSKYW